MNTDTTSETAGANRPEFTRPRFVTPPGFEQGKWGGRFPQCPYYPMFLGNGRDAMLINIGGSGDGHWEYTPFSSGPINKLHSIGWYKADRRVRRPDLGVYGPLVCFLEFTSRPMVDGEVLVPREIAQYFDPHTATLTTLFEQRDNRSGEATKLRIRTWLHSRGVLVEEIEVLSTPECGMSYSFCLNTPSYGYQNTTVPTVQPEHYSFEELEAGRLIKGELFWEKNHAVCASLVEGIEVKEVKRKTVPEQKLEVVEQCTGLLFAGTTIRRYLTVQDSWEEEQGEPKEAVDTIVSRLLAGGIAEWREQHEAEWRSFFGSIAMRVPDAAVQFLYDVSRYFLKANHHECGFQPAGLLPFQWQGTMFWDGALFAEVFLGCGNKREAESILAHIKGFLPQARELAKSFGNRGARIEWTLNFRDFSSYHEQVRQFHNNAVWAMVICQWLESAPQGPKEAEYLEFCEELLRFLCDELLKNHRAGKGGAWMVGIDESVAAPKTSDTWTVVALLAALRRFDQHCRDIRKPHGLEELPEATSVLEEMLAGNIDGTEVLQSFSGGKIPHWGSLVYDLVPGHPSAHPTLTRMSQNYDAGMDLFNFRSISRGAEKAFPWTDFWFCRCLARTNHREAFEYFLHATRSCEYFGGFSERIFYHGEHYISWFTTAHGALIWALHGMIAHVAEKTLHVLPGIDLEQWSEWEVTGLSIGYGLEISLAIRERSVKSLKISNCTGQDKILQLRSPYLGSRELRLKSGDNEVVHDER